MKEEWLFPNAFVPVDVETTSALVAEIRRLIDVVGGLVLKQGPDYERGFIDGMSRQAQSSVDRAVNRMALATPALMQEPVAWGVFDGPNLHDMFFAEEDAKDMARLKGVSSVVRPLTTPPAAQQEPVTILPDGSAFGVMSLPLPEDHWLCVPHQYMPGSFDPVELPSPVTTHADRERVTLAIRYAIRGATMCGKEMDFDPDALVQNAVYALCGPFGTAEQAPPPAAQPVAWMVYTQDGQSVYVTDNPTDIQEGQRALPLYLAPPPCPTCEALARTVMLDQTSHDTQRQWVGLTVDELITLEQKHMRHEDLSRAIEAKLKEKNT